jgi:prevent-host-death family protein
MEIANIHDAKSQLSKLIELALEGEEVIIAKAGKPVIKLVPIRADDAPREAVRATHSRWSGHKRWH